MSKRIPSDASASEPAPAGKHPAPDENLCAREVLKTVPLVMRDIIRHMQSGRDPGMSVVQFRVMVYVQRHPGSSLAQLANFLGMAPPSTSKLVDALVRQKLIQRSVDTKDRRRITLNISPQGQKAHARAQARTLDHLRARLDDLSDAQRRTITRAMVLLYKTVAPPDTLPEAPPGTSLTADAAPSRGGSREASDALPLRPSPPANGSQR